MLTSLEISNFRSIRSLKIEGFARINILAGKNGSGKSTVLEAVELLLNPAPLQPAIQIRRRGLQVLPAQATGESPAVIMPWDNLFNEFGSTTVRLGGRWNGTDVSTSLETKIAASDTTHLNLMARNSSYLLSMQQWLEERRLLRIRSQRTNSPQGLETIVHPAQDGTWTWTASIHPVAPVRSMWAQEPLSPGWLVELYGEVQLQGRDELVLSVMREVVPGLQQLVTISRNGKSELWSKFSSGLIMPVTLLGDGAVRILSILCAGLNLKSGVWLIDEVENGIHYSIMGFFWRHLAKAAELADAQLFCTTHSREAVFVASEELKEDQFQFFRVDRRISEHVAASYRPELLKTAFELDFEFR